MRTTTVSSEGRAAVQAADFRAGALAGVVAGLAMSPLMMAMTTFMMGMGPWPAAKMGWSLVAGKEVIQPGFEVVPVMAGTLVHLMLSAAFGLVFAWLVSLTSIGSVVLGALCGLGLYVTNTLLIPKLLPEWAGHMFPMTGALHLVMAAEHLFFGLVLGFVYRAWRRS